MRRYREIRTTSVEQAIKWCVLKHLESTGDGMQWRSAVPLHCVELIERDGRLVAEYVFFDKRDRGERGEPLGTVAHARRQLQRAEFLARQLEFSF